MKISIDLISDTNNTYCNKSLIIEGYEDRIYFSISDDTREISVDIKELESAIMAIKTINGSNK